MTELTYYKTITLYTRIIKGQEEDKKKNFCLFLMTELTYYKIITVLN